MQPDNGGAGAGGYGGYDQQQAYYGGGMPAPQPYAAAPSPYTPPAQYPTPAQPAYQQYGAQNAYGQYGATPGGGGTETEVFYVEKQYMGRIIGKKGVTINDLQRRSATDLQVNQDVPPGRHCEITIRGSRPGIEMAKQMLKEVIEIGMSFECAFLVSLRYASIKEAHLSELAITGPNHPYAGGGRKFFRYFFAAWLMYPFILSLFVWSSQLPHQVTSKTVDMVNNPSMGTRIKDPTTKATVKDTIRAIRLQSQPTVNRRQTMDKCPTQHLHQ